MCPGDYPAYFQDYYYHRLTNDQSVTTIILKKSDRLVELKKLLPQKKSQTTESDGFFQKFKRSSCPETQDCVFRNVNFLPRGTPQRNRKTHVCYLGCGCLLVVVLVVPFLFVCCCFPPKHNHYESPVRPATPSLPLFYSTQHNFPFLPSLNKSRGRTLLKSIFEV